jgi:hypothetical protein
MLALVVAPTPSPDNGSGMGGCEGGKAAIAAPAEPDAIPFEREAGLAAVEGIVAAVPEQTWAAAVRLWYAHMVVCGRATTLAALHPKHSPDDAPGDTGSPNTHIADAAGHGGGGTANMPVSNADGVGANAQTSTAAPPPPSPLSAETLQGNPLLTMRACCVRDGKHKFKSIEVTPLVGGAINGRSAVHWSARCSGLNRIVQSKMLLGITPLLRLKLLSVCDQ